MPFLSDVIGWLNHGLYAVTGYRLPWFAWVAVAGMVLALCRMLLRQARRRDE